eukprot:8374398-Heterocapsa_arctica.AAC.1
MDQTSGYRTEGCSGLDSPFSSSGVYPPQPMQTRPFLSLAAPPIICYVWNSGLALRCCLWPRGRIGLPLGRAV